MSIFRQSLLHHQHNQQRQITILSYTNKILDYSKFKRVYQEFEAVLTSVLEDQSFIIILNQMHIRKKPSLGKINEKKLSSTAREMFWPKEANSIVKEKEQLPKVPAFRRNLRNISSKQIDNKPRVETETTLSESTMMFQSMYGGKDWLKPSDYIKQIQELNLLGEQRHTELKKYDINLNEKLEKNLEKYGRLKQVTEKWVQVLKKAVAYTHSSKAASDKLIEEVKFWKVLSRKFDELEYEFKEERTMTLLNIMKNVLKTQPAYKPLLQEFLYLKQQIIVITPSVKKLHLQLEEILSGFILKFEQCSNICQSVALLKKIMIGFDSIYEQNPIIKDRFGVIYQKMGQCMTQKLLATSLYPRQLANISSVKQNYQMLDKSLSFYSHFLNSLESNKLNGEEQIERAEYTRDVIGNLLQILTYFEFLYKNKEVHEFSKLFSYPLAFNIYDSQFREEWNQYMELVHESMEKHKFES